MSEKRLGTGVGNSKNVFPGTETRNSPTQTRLDLGEQGSGTAGNNKPGEWEQRVPPLGGTVFTTPTGTEVTCPVCHAEPGHGCITAMGRVMPHLTHANRRRKARATIARNRAEAEAAQRTRQTSATPDPEPGDPT